MLIQQHHYQAVPTHTINLNNGLSEIAPSRGFSAKKSMDQSFSDSIGSLSSISECKRIFCIFLLKRFF